jgi:hypothetical protein
MGRICVELSDELEKQLRFKTVERFGGKTWIAKKE